MREHFRPMIPARTGLYIPYFSPILLFLLASCTVRESTPADTLVVAVETNPRSLDPRFAADSLASKVSELTCPGLTARSPDGTLVPELAESWEWETPTRLRMRLREGVLFHDGTPVEATDVAATYRSILDPATGSIYAGAFSEIARIESPNTREVVFHLKEASVPLLQDLVSPGVMKAGQLGKEAVAFPVCAGAYRAVGFRRDDSVRLEAHPAYWRGAPPIAKIELRILPDATIRVLELAHGSVDLLQNDFPPHFLPVLKKEATVRVDALPGRNLKYLVFNLKHPALKDVRVRRAIASAIDRDAMIRHKLEGLGRPADSVLAPEDPFHAAAGEDAVSFDRARAERLLDDAGLPRIAADGGVRLRLEYKTSMSETAIAVAKVMKSDLAKVGIALTIRPAEFGIFFKDVQTGNFELYSLTSAAVVDPDFHRWLLASENIPPAGGSTNRGGYSNPELDRLIAVGAGQTDPEARKETYRAIQAIVMRDLPVVPLWYETVVAARSERIEGYTLSPFASYVGLATARKNPAGKAAAPR